MKKLFTFILFLSIPVLGFSQVVSGNLRNGAISEDVSKILGSDINIDQDSVSLNGEANKVAHAEFSIQNSGNSNIDVYWKVSKIDFSDQWDFSFCDNVLCYRNLEECPKNKPNKLAAGSISKWDFKVTPNSVNGSGVVVIKLYSDSDFTNFLDEIKINISIFKVSNKEFEDQELTLAPNPASTYFKVLSDKEVANVEVFNIIGKKVKNFEGNNSNYYNISDLRNGAYLVRVLSKAGKVLKVKKLNINH